MTLKWFPKWCYLEITTGRCSTTFKLQTDSPQTNAWDLDKKDHRRMRSKQMWAQQTRALETLSIWSLQVQPAWWCFCSLCTAQVPLCTCPSKLSFASWTGAQSASCRTRMFLSLAYSLLPTSTWFAGCARMAASSYCGAGECRLTDSLAFPQSISCLEPTNVLLHWNPERAVRRIELVRSRGEIKEAWNRKRGLGWCSGWVEL